MDLEYAKFILEKTRKDYNLIAKEFSTTRREIWDELLFLFENLKEGEKVLDLGCGNGRWYKIFKEKKVNYFGIDNSEKLIEIAKENFPSAKFFVGDALNLPFQDNFFDKIYSIALLHHIPSGEFRIKVLNETKRVLKTGGILILTCWKIHRWREILAFLKYTFLKLIGISKLDFKDIFLPWGKKTMRYYHCFSKKELEDLVKKAGFEILKSGVVKNNRGNRQNYYIVCQKPL
jgi:ubiquinone/menaquinone biosynthesis C-methylase UbiE